MQIEIKVIKIDGYCPVYKIDDKIIIDNGYKLNLKETSAICIHSLAFISNIFTTNYSLLEQADKIHINCPANADTSCGRVTFEITTYQSSIYNPQSTINESTLHTIMKRRGFYDIKDSSFKNVIHPEPLTEESISKYYQLLKKYSFRLVMRDVIKYCDGFFPENLTHYCSLNTVNNYISLLENLKIVEKIDGKSKKQESSIKKKKSNTYKLCKSDVNNFGTTLEWFISQVMIREFSAQSIWEVKVKGIDVGGDYDVISYLENRLIYIESKSSPPKNIHESEIGQFLNRVNMLNPNFSIFLVDTQLRLEDKILKMFKWELNKLFPDESVNEHTPQKVLQKIFVLPKYKIIIINSKTDLIKNIGMAIKTGMKLSL